MYRTRDNAGLLRSSITGALEPTAEHAVTKLLDGTADVVDLLCVKGNVRMHRTKPAGCGTVEE